MPFPPGIIFSVHISGKLRQRFVALVAPADQRTHFIDCADFLFIVPERTDHIHRLRCQRCRKTMAAGFYIMHPDILPDPVDLLIRYRQKVRAAASAAAALTVDAAVNRFPVGFFL